MKVETCFHPRSLVMECLHCQLVSFFPPYFCLGVNSHPYLSTVPLSVWRSGLASMSVGRLRLPTGVGVGCLWDCTF
jgi:hypothetical protein